MNYRGKHARKRGTNKACVHYMISITHDSKVFDRIQELVSDNFCHQKPAPQTTILNIDPMAYKYIDSCLQAVAGSGKK